MNNRILELLDNIIEAGLLFLIVFSPLAFGSVEVWAQTVIEVVVFVMFLMWMFKIIIKKEIILRKSLNIPILLFLALVLFQILPMPISMLRFFSNTYKFYNEAVSGKLVALGNVSNWHQLSVYWYATHVELLKMVAYALIFLTIINNITGREQIKRILWVIVITGFVISIFAIIQKFTWNGKIYWVKKINSGAPCGPYVNRDHFAGYINMVIPLGFGLMVSLTNNSKKILTGFITTIMISCSFLSLSRGGVLSFMGAMVFLSLMFLFFKKYGKEKIWYIVGVLSTVLVFVFWLDWAPVIARLATFADKEGGILYPRLPVWLASVGLLRDFTLFGTGLGTYFCTFPMYRPDEINSLFVHAHNDYLQIFTELGVVGVAVVLIFFILFFRHVVRRLFFLKHKTIKGLPSSASDLIIAGLASIMTMLLHSFIDFNLRITANAVLFIIILGLVFSLAKSNREKEAQFFVIRLKGVKSYLFYCSIIVFSIVFIFKIGTIFLADRYFSKGMINRTNFTDNVHNFKKAVQMNSKNARYHHYLGLVYEKEAAKENMPLREREVLKRYAQSEIAQSIKLAPSIGRYWASYAWIINNLEGGKKANYFMNQAIKLDPYNSAINELKKEMGVKN